MVILTPPEDFSSEKLDLLRREFKAPAFMFSSLEDKAGFDPSVAKIESGPGRDRLTRDLNIHEGLRRFRADLGIGLKHHEGLRACWATAMESRWRISCGKFSNSCPPSKERKKKERTSPPQKSPPPAGTKSTKKQGQRRPRLLGGVSKGAQGCQRTTGNRRSQGESTFFAQGA